MMCSDADTMVKVVIDPEAGFCGGVKRAIEKVEDELGKGDDIYVRGALIHNRREMERLHRRGLKISPELKAVSGKALFIRTHGETPVVYRQARKQGIRIIDATCRNVRRSQRVIAAAAKEGRRIYIFGKKRHPEVIGLLGYCQSKGIVIESPSEALEVSNDASALLIPQTTADREQFEALKGLMHNRLKDFQVYDAICPFVSHREEELMDFAGLYDAVVFVGGRHSSNTAVLFSCCKRVNPNSFFIEKPEELELDKLAGFSSIGISGSASTPMWQLEEIADIIVKEIKKPV